jgi:hypothetical protein
MPAAMTHEDGGLYRLEISGTLQRAELDPWERTLVDAVSRDGRIRLLVIVKQFTGWAAGDGWNDLSFYAEHGDHIERIAIVADARWQDALMLFANADLRRGEVRFFVPGGMSQARAWLAE